MQPRTKELLLLTLIAVVTPLAAAGITQHVFEDYLITFKSSKNLSLGNGLVYHPGERVHTFTSPLGVLLLALFARITDNASDMLTLWLFRLVSIAAFAVSVLVTRFTFERWSTGTLFAVCGCLMIVTDAKMIDFSINGMETGMLMLFLSLLVYGISRRLSRATTAIIILAVAGLMWTRPDAFIYISALTFAFFVFRCGAFDGLNITTILKTGLFVTVSSLLLYLPWLVFAEVYYGTPIPNTVAAKGLTVSPELDDLVKNTLLFPLGVLRWGWSVTDTFLPSYARILGGWPWYVEELGHAAGIIAAFHWMLPVASPFGRAASLAACLTHVYLSIVAPFVYPWYVPVATYFSILSLMSLMSSVTRFSEPVLWSLDWKKLNRFGAVALVIGSAGLLCASTYQLYFHQKIVESGNRKRIGNWLAEHARPGDTVFMECLGYIGYYSGLKTLDFPGLSSKEMVAARRQLLSSGDANNWAAIIAQLEPDWLVLRPTEISLVGEQDPDLFGGAYQQRKTFDVSDQVSQLEGVPGRGYLRYDQIFVVWQRKEQPAIE